MSILAQKLDNAIANLPIAEYLLDVIAELDGVGLVITEPELLCEEIAKMMETGFPVLRGLLSPLSDVGTMRETSESVFPEAQEPVKCGNCGWLGFQSELEPCNLGEPAHCPRCFSNDHIGSVVPTANVERQCYSCRWIGLKSQLVTDTTNPDDCMRCPKCFSDQVGSVIPTSEASNVEPIVNCAVCPKFDWRRAYCCREDK